MSFYDLKKALELLEQDFIFIIGERKQGKTQDINTSKKYYEELFKKREREKEIFQLKLSPLLQHLLIFYPYGKIKDKINFIDYTKTKTTFMESVEKSNILYVMNDVISTLQGFTLQQESKIFMLKNYINLIEEDNKRLKSEIEYANKIHEDKEKEIKYLKQKIIEKENEEVLNPYTIDNVNYLYNSVDQLSNSVNKLLNKNDSIINLLSIYINKPNKHQQKYVSLELDRLGYKIIIDKRSKQKRIINKC